MLVSIYWSWSIFAYICVFRDILICWYFVLFLFSLYIHSICHLGSFEYQEIKSCSKIFHNYDINYNPVTSQNEMADLMLSTITIKVHIQGASETLCTFVIYFSNFALHNERYEKIVIWADKLMAIIIVINTHVKQTFIYVCIHVILILQFLAHYNIFFVCFGFNVFFPFLDKLHENSYSKLIQTKLWIFLC